MPESVMGWQWWVNGRRRGDVTAQSELDAIRIGPFYSGENPSGQYTVRTLVVWDYWHESYDALPQRVAFGSVAFGPVI